MTSDDAKKFGFLIDKVVQKRDVENNSSKVSIMSKISDSGDSKNTLYCSFYGKKPT